MELESLEMDPGILHSTKLQGDALFFQSSCIDPANICGNL